MGWCFRRVWRSRHDRVFHHRLWDRAGKTARLAYDATEETQYIIAGTGELHMEDGGTYRVGPGSVFAIPTPVKHDLVNVGNETLRAVAFFAAAMFTQSFDNVMMPPKSPILGSPNREG